MNTWATEGLAGSVADIETNEVLQNLQAFATNNADNVYANPSQLVLSGTNSSLSDTVGLTDQYGAALYSKASFSLTPVANSTWGGGITSVPVTDPEDSARLRALYRFAWGWHQDPTGKWSPGAGSQTKLNDLYALYPPQYLKAASGGPMLCYLNGPHANSQSYALSYNDSKEYPKPEPTFDSTKLLPTPSSSIPNCADVSPYVYKIEDTTEDIPYKNSNYTFTKDERFANYVPALVLASPFEQSQIFSRARGLDTQWIKLGPACEQSWVSYGVSPSICYQKGELDQFVALVLAATPNTQGGGAGGAGGGGGGGGGGSNSGGGKGGKK